MASKDDILKKFHLFRGDTGGIDSWLVPTSPDVIFERLGEIAEVPLSESQFEQLLILAGQAGFSHDFFQYYWLSIPGDHPYDVKKIPDFDPAFSGTTVISSLNHLHWGMYRFYVDALLFFGNLRTAYRTLREKSTKDLEQIFTRYPTEFLENRGPSLKLHSIARDKRYLISEMACKSFGETPQEESDLLNILRDNLRAYLARNEGKKIKIKDLLSSERLTEGQESKSVQLRLSADDIMEEDVASIDELMAKYPRIATDFLEARGLAIKNTEYYLSTVNNLDVYVATSMRNRDDFRKVAQQCDTIFKDEILKDLNIRYFDPTLSAADGHEDKGLIECLMVKCAKILVYCVGEKESWGKDAEATMALTLGKPVIFLCDTEEKFRFFRDVHPLTRLIDFQSGVANGVIVTRNINDVPLLISRILRNDMEFELNLLRPGYFRLIEKLTGSIVRLQTNFELLRNTFWNYYHGQRSGPL